MFGTNSHETYSWPEPQLLRQIAKKALQSLHISKLEWTTEKHIQGIRLTLSDGSISPSQNFGLACFCDKQQLFD
jgi:hypothetical protein